MIQVSLPVSLFSLLAPSSDSMGGTTFGAVMNTEYKIYIIDNINLQFHLLKLTKKRF